MKPVKKVKYVGFGSYFHPSTFFLTKILFEKFNLIESDEPDYVICSTFGHPYEYCKYDAIRIFYSGENFAPDFNLVDYAIGSDNIIFGDRYFRHSDAFNIELSNLKRGMAHEELLAKEYFANFIVGHESEFNLRGDFFKLLSSTYKRVESVGSFLNNMPDGQSVTRVEKDSFVKRCKFTICFESTQYLDFTTEKIVDAFLGNTIPIYLGNPNIYEIFNPEAFINVKDRSDFERAIKLIKYLDENDEEYLKMMSQPVYIKDTLVDEQMSKLRDFLFKIFDQPLETARRRSVVYLPKSYDKMLYSKFNEKTHRKRHVISNLKSKVAELFPELYRRHHVKKYGMK